MGAQTGDMAMKAMIYLRVSTDEQARRGYGLGDQSDDCQGRVQQNTYTLVGPGYSARDEYKLAGMYVDDFTGMSMERPALDRMREDIVTYGAQVVVIADMDRLARKAVYSALLEEELEELGARVE